MTVPQIPTLLLTGYLGSGKTTLVNKILNNRKGIKFAVIVNDIGEVNIDADLIEKGGIVGQGDDSLMALQNGCICCTLKMDLVKQLSEITAMKRFDYIVIEASGICEPEPIAQTICTYPRMGYEFFKDGLARLDCIVTVVDALRLQDEFACGDNLVGKTLKEDDLESLVIQQIEFCNVILLNKASEVSDYERGRIKEIIRALQPKAEIIECDYCDIDFDKILKLCKRHGWQLVFNILAENVDQIDSLCGPELVYLLEQNAQYIVNRYEPQGVIVVNNLKEVRDDDFRDRGFPTEHYKQTGRVTIAKNVAEAIKQRLH